MNWYYVDAGQQAGPVDDAQLEELLRSGKIQNDTLIWREGMANWQPYSQAKVPAQTTPASPAAYDGPIPGSAKPEAVCVECGKMFNTDDMIRHGGNYVCASCKPIFMQKLSEGVSGSAQQRGAASQADLLTRDYDVDIGGCLSHSWAVFKASAGIIIGATVLVYLCMFAINVIPYLNIVLAILLTGPLMGGLWFFYVKKVRQEEASIGDAFRGFGPRFWQFVLVQIIPSLLAMAFVFVIGLMAALTIPAIVGPSRGGGGGASGTMPTVMLIILGVLVLVGMVVMIYFNMCWMFALPLVGDKGLKFWPALELSRRVVSKHWWMTFWLMVVCGIVSLLGILACGVGLLVSGPVAFGALVTHYNRVFGDLASSE